jgi:peptide/nickel transport system permease protein
MYPQVTIKEGAAPQPTAPARGRPAVIGILLQIGSLLLANRKATLGFLLLAVFVVMAVFAPMIAPYDPNSTDFFPTTPPSSSHLLGTTALGQDIYSQLIWGARETLIIGGVAGFITTFLAVLIGVSAAYLGGIPDNILSSLTDIFLVIPALPLMIIIAAFAQGGGMWVLIGVISLTGWSYGARQLRPQALSLRNRDFLESARVRGENRFYIIVVELLPNMTSLIVAIFLGAALYAILAAAGLQFIGLGNTADLSWGTMLYWGENNEALLAGAPWWVIAPGACIALVGASVALINNAVDEIANPALRGTRRKGGRRSTAAGS